MSEQSWSDEYEHAFGAAGDGRFALTPKERFEVRQIFEELLKPELDHITKIDHNEVVISRQLFPGEGELDKQDVEWENTTDGWINPVFLKEWFDTLAPWQQWWIRHIDCGGKFRTFQGRKGPYLICTCGVERPQARTDSDD